MKQSSFDDDELFGEAAEDLRGDVETALGDARGALPDPDEVWTAEGDNVLGVLNGLRGAMETEAAREHLREARKWLTVAERADAFEDEDLEADVEAVEAVLADLEESRERISDLAGTIPELRSDLEDLHADEAAAGATDEDDHAAADGGEPGDAGTDEGSEEQATLDGE